LLPANPAPAEDQLAPGLTDDVIAQVTQRVTEQVRRELGQMMNFPVPEASRQSPPVVPAVQPSQTITVSPVSSADVTEVPIHSPGLPTTHGTEGELRNPFVSNSLAIDSRVSDKLKQKIWNHEYIDFGALLANPTAPTRYRVALDNDEAQLTLEAADKIRKISSIETWLTAFHIFVGVYTLRYSSEAPSLMKYGSLIRDLAARGQNWRFYDENFRFMRQTHVHSLPWGSIHSELWLRSHVQASKSNYVGQPPSRKNDRSFSIPTGYCVKFHRGVHCSGCRFKHLCFKCAGNHPVSNCTFRPPGSNVRGNGSTPSSTVAAKSPRPSNTDQGK